MAVAVTAVGVSPQTCFVLHFHLALVVHYRYPVPPTVFPPVGIEMWKSFGTQDLLPEFSPSFVFAVCFASSVFDFSCAFSVCVLLSLFVPLLLVFVVYPVMPDCVCLATSVAQKWCDSLVSIHAVGPPSTCENGLLSGEGVDVI